MNKKICKICKDPSAELLPNRRICKDCWAAQMKDRYHNHPGERERVLARSSKRWKEIGHTEHISRKFNLTFEEFHQMMAEQNHKCKICSRELDSHDRRSRPAVDHDHKTGKVRGIICTSCNLGIGNFEDSIESLENAITYLKEAA